MPHDLTTPTGREELRRLLSLPDAETYTPAQFTVTRDEMRAVLAGEWRPIESAPKSRHAILIWCPEYQNIYAVTWCEWHGWCVFGAGSHERLQQEPTHWQPLPPPPVRAAAEEK